MVDNPLSTIFGFIGSFYGLVVPLVTITFITLLFLVALSVSGAKPKNIGEAVYCYFMHGVSVMLMTIGALPTVFSVFAGVSYTGRTYVALLLTFACGGLLFLVQDQSARNLDAASKVVIEAIYMTTLKVIGNLLALLSGVSILLSVILVAFEPGWWVTPFVVFLYGLLLSWCTKGGKEWEIVKALHAPAPVAPVKTQATKSRSSTKKRTVRKKRK